MMLKAAFTQEGWPFMHKWGMRGRNGYALHMNFVRHTKTSFTRRVHTNGLELWSFSQGVQAFLVRQQSWRGGISNESNSHADICKPHTQWIHCFKQSHQSYLPTGQWPGLNHLLFRVAKCLARGQKFKKSLQNTAYKCFFFYIDWCGWSICAIRMSPVNVLNPALRVKVIKELLELEKCLTICATYLKTVWK